ncbi:WYL domain-containing protein [Actinomadura rupiterrae]|uniref:WYL domain-containing protein n=1 Tax=Actinomadura rupiterrae TaxID=559627 RepID=UPI0020A56436|nr:WYL domain-containing protein [Actinomadura rupiterrae]MCP2339184.1 putative DNA-binding transcriptional regulator YafY [Actinomadura rupiterrae]
MTPIAPPSAAALFANQALMIRAAEFERPVLIAYSDAEGVSTLRIIEPYAVETTRAGHLLVRAMDRLSEEPRTFRLDRIVSADLLRGPLLLDRPARDALTRIREEIARIQPTGYYSDAARWTPDCPIYP